MFILISVFLATLPGCGGDDVEPQQETTQPESPTQSSANTEPTPSGLLIEQAVAFWSLGKKDQAADTLLTVEWSPLNPLSRGNLTRLPGAEIE